MAKLSGESISFCGVILVCLESLASGILEVEDIDGYNEEICGKSFGKSGGANDRAAGESWLDYDEGALNEHMSPRMSAGWRAAKGEIPWYVYLSVKYPDKFGTCGGVLISDNLVLTAAHCLYNDSRTVSTADIVVYLGKSNRSYVRATRYGVKACVPLDWRHPIEKRRDIGLLVLDQSIPYDKYIQPACLSSRASISDKDCVAAGFGRMSNSPLLHPDNLLVLPMKKCERNQDISVQSDFDACYTAANKKHLGTPCRGDSGGGVFCKAHGRRYVTALVSRGPSASCNTGQSINTTFSDVYAQKHILRLLFNECVNNREQPKLYRSYTSSEW